MMTTKPPSPITTAAAHGLMHAHHVTSGASDRDQAFIVALVEAARLGASGQILDIYQRHAREMAALRLKLDQALDEINRLKETKCEER